MAQLSLIPQAKTEEEKQRKQLLRSIKKRQQILQRLVVRSETLKVRLDMLKREYMVTIGSLVVKDNHLDLDIIRYRNIISLMEEGKSFAEATKELESTFYAEQLEIEQEEENIRHAEKILEKGNREQSESVLANMKKLWRKLISLYHPDLTQDLKEKKRREEIMKQINLAYEEGDLSRLTQIERDNTVVHELPNVGLEEMLVKIENEILDQEKQYETLKQSEWYKWHSKISKGNQTMHALFAQVEKKLLNDIVAKMEIVNELKQKITKLERSPST